MTKGMSTRVTSLGFHVLRLRYDADPDKDPATEQGRRWLKQAESGMSDARWRKEYEIDYGALGGQLVFPEFDISTHIVEQRTLDPREWTVDSRRSAFSGLRKDSWNLEAHRPFR